MSHSPYSTRLLVDGSRLDLYLTKFAALSIILMAIIALTTFHQKIIAIFKIFDRIEFTIRIWQNTIRRLFMFRNLHHFCVLDREHYTNANHVHRRAKSLSIVECRILL